MIHLPPGAFLSVEGAWPRVNWGGGGSAEIMRRPCLLRAQGGDWHPVPGYQSPNAPLLKGAYLMGGTVPHNFGENQFFPGLRASVGSRIIFSKLFSLFCRDGPMCPPYFRANPQVRPYENIENRTWDTTLDSHPVIIKSPRRESHERSMILMSMSVRQSSSGPVKVIYSFKSIIILLIIITANKKIIIDKTFSITSLRVNQGRSATSSSQ